MKQGLKKEALAGAKSEIEKVLELYDLHDYTSNLTRNKIKSQQQWFKMFERNFFMASYVLTPNTFSFLCRMISLSDKDNFVYMSANAISTKFRLSKRAVQKYVREANRYNLVLKVRPFIDSSLAYRINPAFFWRGNIRKFNEAMSKLDYTHSITWKPYFDDSLKKKKDHDEENPQVAAERVAAQYELSKAGSQ